MFCSRQQDGASCKVSPKIFAVVCAGPYFGFKSESQATMKHTTQKRCGYGSDANLLRIARSPITNVSESTMHKIRLSRRL